MSKRLHVCHITTVHPSKDVRIFHKECRSLAKAGYKVTLLVGNGESEQLDGVDIIGVPCNYSGRIGRFMKLGKALRRAAESLDADIYHFHDPEFLLQARKLKRAGKKVVYDAHEDLPRQILNKHYLPSFIARFLSGRLEAFENKVAAKVDAVVTVTEHIASRFARVNASVHIVKNYPILDPRLHPSPFEKKEPCLCYIGSITRVRGIVEMVKALEQCNTTLELGGEFSPEELEKETRSLPAWDRVNFHGYADRDKVSDILAKSMIGMVTLHPIINYRDALPVKMFEYMAAGIPVICSDIPLWRSIVEEADCGLAADPLDPSTIAYAINTLLSDRENCARLGANGRKAVEERFNWEIEEKKLLDLYAELSRND